MTGGYSRSTALLKSLNIKLDEPRAGETKVQFGIRYSNSLGTAEVITLVGKSVFHIVSADTPFLLSLKHLDDLEVEIDNLMKFTNPKRKAYPNF